MEHYGSLTMPQRSRIVTQKTSEKWTEPKIPLPTDFCDFVPWAVSQYHLDYEVLVSRTQMIDRPTSRMHHHRVSKAKIKQVHIEDERSTKSIINYNIHSPSKQPNTVHIAAVYQGDRLVSVKIIKNKEIPKTLLHVIDMTVQFQPFLTTIVLDRADETIIDEVKMLLNHSHITDIYLDNSVVTQGNYDVLLDCENCRVLSLSMCTITDVDVQCIAEKLDISHNQSLIVLNLATNLITDVGAKYLAHMLRTNRTLVYLNLAHNQISDDGAKYLFDVLKEFPLTEDEINKSIERQVAFKTKTLNLFLSIFNTSTTSTPRLESRHRKLRENKSAKSKVEIAQDEAKKQMGEYVDPFSARNTIRIGEVVHCRGNYTLRHLNLAYNSLTYLSVKLILDVLSRQSKMLDPSGGLLNIRIEGNFLPPQCSEYDKIDYYLRCSRERILKYKYKLRKDTARPKSELFMNGPLSLSKLPPPSRGRLH